MSSQSVLLLSRNLHFPFYLSYIQLPILFWFPILFLSLKLGFSHAPSSSTYSLPLLRDYSFLNDFALSLGLVKRFFLGFEYIYISQSLFCCLSLFVLWLLVLDAQISKWAPQYSHILVPFFFFFFFLLNYNDCRNSVGDLCFMVYTSFFLCHMSWFAHMCRFCAWVS